MNNEPTGGHEHSQRELEKRVYHLKTLFDVSQEISFMKGVEEISKTLLTMIMGTFGSLSGIVVLVDTDKGCIETISRRGIEGDVESELSCVIDADILEELRESTEIEIISGEAGRRNRDGRKLLEVLARFKVDIWIPFRVNDVLQGGIGLGEKILGEEYTADDQELLFTLTKQGAVALENAVLVEQMKREEIVRTNLSRYLSPQIVEQVISNDLDVNLGGARNVVTALFSDIRGFTSISEAQPPDRLVRILNEYFTAMANCVFENQGTIDKYIGDAVMATFGGLVPLENSARSAVNAALRMMEILPELNERWQRDYDGFTVQIGVGITTGEVFLGNIGSPERMEYTVIGDTVNVASRFSGLAGAGQVIVGRETLDALGVEFRYRALPPAIVKGKSGKIEIFEILA